MELYDGDDIIGWFEGVAENAAAAQTQTLRRILERNCRAEYLRKWLGGDVEIHDVPDSELESLYTRLVPLATYADFEPYIQRIADGDTTPLLTQQPITSLSVTSGTSGGRPKYIPFIRCYAKLYLQVYRLSAAFKSRAYRTKEGGKALEFIYCNKQLKPKGGLKVAPISAHLLSSEEFTIKQEKIKSFACSPPEVISGGDYKESTYCHLLLGLFFSDQVEFLGANRAYTIVQAFTAFQDLWIDLCHDIKEGALSSVRVSCPKMRKAVLDIIYPNPSLASKIEENCRELESSNWFSLIPTLWPNAKYVCTIVTGTMRPYLKKLRHYARDLPLVTLNYGSSESLIGVNADPCSPPETATYTIIPTVSYYEFIPLYKHKESCNISHSNDYMEDEPIPLSQVKVGQKYEIILTTYGGLYRYRLGDVVEVAGFHKGAPKLNFVHRRNLILCIAMEQTTEEDLHIVVERGSEVLISKAPNAELVDFTSHADISNQPGHYVIYWEIKGHGGIENIVLQECCTEMDASLARILSYSVSRKKNMISPLELCIVEDGTFKKILDYFVENGGAVSQFKTPKCTNNQGVLKILNTCTAKRFRSTAYND